MSKGNSEPLPLPQTPSQVTGCGSAGDPTAIATMGASTLQRVPGAHQSDMAFRCEQGHTSPSVGVETGAATATFLRCSSGVFFFMLCFCLENIPRDGEGGSCWGSLLCQHLNRSCSGCSHLIHTVPHFQSLFQSCYLSLKTFNCFLSVSRLESAQVSGWRYPPGHGIVALSSRAAQVPLQPSWGCLADFSPWSLGA